MLLVKYSDTWWRQSILQPIKMVARYQTNPLVVVAYMPPLIMVILILTSKLCILNLVVKFISSDLEAIKFQMVLQMKPCMDPPFFQGPIDPQNEP